MAQDLPVVVIKLYTTKIIIPDYNQQLSPEYAWCMRIIILDFLSGEEVHREEIDLSVLPGLEYIKRLIDPGAATTPCSVISMKLEDIVT